MCVCVCVCVTNLPSIKKQLCGFNHVHENFEPAQRQLDVIAATTSIVLHLKL